MPEGGLVNLKSVAVQVKAGPDDGLGEGQFVVYPATFIRQPDSYGDVVAKGAFVDDIKAWEESGNVMPGLYGHRLDDPDYSIAYATSSTEDEKGWRVEGQFDMENPKAVQVYKLVKGKRLNQLSFAYDVIDQSEVQLEDGTKANELRKLKVYEFSFVPIGANQDTSVVAIKSVAEQVAVVEANLKAGRVFSAKNETTLREIGAQAAEIATGIKNLLSALGEDNQEKASTTSPAKDSSPDQAKSDEPSEVVSVDDLADELLNLEIEGASL